MYPRGILRRQSRLRLITGAAVIVAVLIAVAFFTQGKAHATLVLPWFLPATGSLLFVIAAFVAFLAFGRYYVTWDTASFWVGVGSSGFAVGMLFNVLTFPGLLPGEGQLIGKLSTTAVWEGSSALFWLGSSLLLAAVLNWPREWPAQRLSWSWAMVWWISGILVLHILIFWFEEYLPPLIGPDGSFTMLFRGINGVYLMAVSAIGVVLSTRRSSRKADALTGYIAVCQLALLAVAMMTLVEITRWDLLWYIQRLLWVGGFLAMFFGLLWEYVYLFRYEQEKGKELAATSMELKKSEEQLRYSETTLRIAIDATALGTFDFYPRTGELIWSDQAKLHFGLPPQAETSYGVFQSALHPDDRERVKGLLQQALQPGSDGKYRAEYRTIGLTDGKERWLIARGQAFFDERGEATRVVGATLDMTDRIKAEARLRRIFDSGMIGIFYWNMKGEIIDANDRFLQMLGRSRGELEAGAMKWGELTAEEYRPNDQRVLEELKSGGSPPPYEKEFLRSDGSRIPVIFGGAMLEERGDEGVAFVLDITDRKQMEEELRKARSHLEVRVRERTEELSRALQELKAETEERVHAVEELRLREQLLMQQSRLAAMGEMLVNISHQWRQPLNVVGLLLQTLLRNYDRGNFSRELLEKNVTRGVELIGHMSRTIEDFSSYLSPDRVKMPFDVGEVVARAVSMMSETLRGIEVVVEGGTEPVVASGFRNQYAQVLINILINARDAFQENGTGAPRIVIRVASENGTSLVTIADNAGGIPAAVMEKVFEPYFTTKEAGKGTGIGLFMAKTIIEKSMGGRLSVRNTGEGAEFRIEV